MQTDIYAADQIIKIEDIATEMIEIKHVNRKGSRKSKGNRQIKKLPQSL